MKWLVYVDESGRPGLEPRSGKRRRLLFVLAGIMLSEEDAQRLYKSYKGMLESSLEGASGRFSLRELFDIYRRVTGKSPEVKAGWVLGGEGPFYPLRDAPRDVRRSIALQVLGSMLDAAVKHAHRVYIVAVDKHLLYEQASMIEERARVSLNTRVFALDFLLNRVLREARDREVTIIHDYVSEANTIRDYLALTASRGYIYNPRLRLNPDAYRRVILEFRDSGAEPLLQYADIVAYAARSMRSGVTHEEEEHLYRQYFYVNPAGRVVWLEYTRTRR